MKKDVHLFYYGASGGFFALHLLLLTNLYRCAFFGKYQDYKQIIPYQWKINDVSKWKSLEVWPDNESTFSLQTDARKVYFTCNPTPEQVDQYDGIKVLLYTSLDTQWYLAKTKRAKWFAPACQTPQYLDDQLSSRYSKIKFIHWPQCSTVEQFLNLPEDIQRICREKYHFWDILDVSKFDEIDYSPLGEDFNGVTVCHEVLSVADKMDVTVTLRDLIRTRGKILFDQLDIDCQFNLTEFVTRYVQLHTATQRKYLLR
jgi:hypothetical protein